MAANAAYWTIAAVAGATAVDQHESTRAARNEAEREAQRQRDALARMQQEAEPVMPLTDDASIRRARRQSITQQMRRRGRASTILTDNAAGDVLGT